MKSKYVLYYVEGEDEVKLIDVLKSNLRVIKAGKVQKLNVLQQEITTARLRTIKPATMIVLVFDTDTNNHNIIAEVVDMLKLNGYKVLYVPYITTICIDW